MKNKYIIDTWNGQGYSESGIIDIVDTIEDAKKIAWQEFKDRYLQMVDPTFGDGGYEIQFTDDRYLCHEQDSSDSGAITIIEGDFDGIYINPSLNECVGMNEEEYHEMIQYMLDNCEEEDELKSFKEELNMNGNAGLHTSEGYYIIYNLIN